MGQFSDGRLRIGPVREGAYDRPIQFQRERSRRPVSPFVMLPLSDSRPSTFSAVGSRPVPSHHRRTLARHRAFGLLPFLFQGVSDVTMPGAMVSALALEIGGAVLVVWLTWRAATGQLGRNDLAGVRTRVTMSSDDAWRTGHRAALPPTLISSVISVLWCAVRIIAPALRTPAPVIVASVILVGAAVLSILAAHLAVRRAALEDQTGYEDAQTDTPASGRGR